MRCRYSLTSSPVFHALRTPPPKSDAGMRVTGFIPNPLGWASPAPVAPQKGGKFDTV